jgi:hypothetical protein
VDGVAAILECLTGTRPRPRCPRCGARTALLSDEAVQTFPPLFELVFRCPACGVLTTRYLAVEVFE